MKRLTMIVTVLSIFVLSGTETYANDRAVNGLIIGGGTGALVGQAIGRNTESTIIGATVGGALGLIVGSEMNRHHGGGRNYYGHRPVIVHQQRDYRPRRHHDFKKKRNHYRRSHVFKKERRHYRDHGPVCRETFIKQRGHHGNRRVIKTVCRDDYRPRFKPHRRDRHRDRFFR